MLFLGCLPIQADEKKEMKGMGMPQAFQLALPRELGSREIRPLKAL